MGKKTHRFVVHEARRISHPTFPLIDKHWFTVPACSFPGGISTKANARDPIGLNRRVYRDVKDSLTGKNATPGTFDLMNKGITILADTVRLVDKESRIYEVTIDDELGIVDGAHTAKLIEEANGEDSIPPEQYVEVYIKTGVNNELVPDIAKGLNTGMQVKPQSIFNIDGVFDWLKSEVNGHSYAELISWKESDSGEYDVRDLVGVLECFNIFDFPNDVSKHPISAYEKWSIPLERFAQDYNENYRKNPGLSKYYKLKGLLREALYLHDKIRSDFRLLHNEQGGKAGKLKIVEEASSKRVVFEFPFANLESQKYRLTKGALYPILAAFRNCVIVNKASGNAEWLWGFKSVLALWEEAGRELVSETFLATREIGANPDQIGKSRNHWANLHKTLELRVLRQRIKNEGK
jgi:hypothetical protein